MCQSSCVVVRSCEWETENSCTRTNHGTYLMWFHITFFGALALQIPWFWYLALSLIDVQGNYLVVKAYQYSYITSVTLLDCWTVLWVILLTWYALGTRYSFWQFLGAGTCVAGLSLVLLSDVKSPDEQDPRKIPLLGMPLLLPGQFVMHLARLVRLVMHCISCCYQQYFLKFLECTIFLEYVGIWCQDNRSNRSCRNAWTIWITC